MTQADLAEAAAITSVYVSQIERDLSQPSTPVIFRIAAALQVTPSRLLDRSEKLDRGDGDRGILGIRNALQDVTDLPGLDIGDGTGRPADLDYLKDQVAFGWELYWQGRFGALASLLPPLIRAAHATERDLGPQACGPFAQVFQLAADLLVHVGDDALAYGAAWRAVDTAHRGDDPLQHATLAGTISWIWLHAGRLDKAEKIAAAAAEQIRPAGRVPAEHLTVYGSLLLSAMAPAAAAGNGDAADGYLSEAGVVALRFTQGDRHDYRTNFGPSQLDMQRTHAWTVLGRPDAALKAASRVRRADLLGISWGALHMDVARSCLDMHRTPAAVRSLLTGLEVSAEWARHQGQWRDLSAAAVRAATRMSPETRKLARAAGMG